MSDVLRTVKLTDEQMDRIYSVLESDNAQFLARLMQEFLQRQALEKAKAWSEVVRIANVDRDTEDVRVSYVTNEIIVSKKKEGNSDPDVKIWDIFN